MDQVKKSLQGERWNKNIGGGEGETRNTYLKEVNQKQNMYYTKSVQNVMTENLRRPSERQASFHWENIRLLCYGRICPLLKAMACKYKPRNSKKHETKDKRKKWFTARH